MAAQRCQDSSPNAFSKQGSIRLIQREGEGCSCALKAGIRRSFSSSSLISRGVKSFLCRCPEVKPLSQRSLRSPHRGGCCPLLLLWWCGAPSSIIYSLHAFAFTCSSEGLWGTKTRCWACTDLLRARRCSCISQPRGQCHGWGMRGGDYSVSAHFQLITQGERARLWALQKMDTDPVASWKLHFSPVEHLSGCVNPLPALSSPLHTMETLHP